MKKDVYLKKTQIDTGVLVSEILGSPEKDPLTFRNQSKVSFEQEYASSVKEIQAAVKKQAPIIHIQQEQAKFYPVLTPYSGRPELKGLEELVYQMYGVIGLIDTYPMRYMTEDENIIRAVAPRQGSEKECSSQSPYNHLDWHVDAAYRPMNQKEHLSPLPDYLIFGVVHKGHQSLPMMYIALEDILNQLSAKEIEMGLKPQFSVLSTDSFSQKVESKHIPLLTKNENGSFYSRITLQNAKPMTQEAAEFLEKLRGITNQEFIQHRIHVNPGDIIILNNKLVLHKRDPFEPKWDGKDRYFLRVYSVKDLGEGVSKDDQEQWVWI